MTSESETSSTEGEATVIDMADLGVRVARRREALSIPDLPRNAGARRSPSKRALLKAIEDAGGRW